MSKPEQIEKIITQLDAGAEMLRQLSRTFDQVATALNVLVVALREADDV